MRESPYSAQAALVGAARRRPELWRLGLGVVLTGALVVVLNTALQSVIARVFPAVWATHFALPEGPGTTPLSLLVTLFSFGFLVLGVAVAVRVLHERGLGSVVGQRGAFWRQFGQVMRVVVILGAILMVLPPYGMGMELEQNLPVRQWLLLLPLGLLAVLVQSSAEEILFRGYIQQQLAARFRSAWVWMVVPAVLFGFGHYLPVQAGENAFLIALWSGVFGVLMADLTARAGTLGPAIALHFVNNVSALLFVSLPDNLDGLALYVTPVDMSDTGALRSWLPVDFAITIIGWLAARLAIRR